MKSGEIRYYDHKGEPTPNAWNSSDASWRAAGHPSHAHELARLQKERDDLLVLLEAAEKDARPVRQERALRRMEQVVNDFGKTADEFIKALKAIPEPRRRPSVPTRQEARDGKTRHR